MGAEWNWPAWLKPLLRESFFKHCELHPQSHKTECNMLCLDCVDRGPICSHCSVNHKNHYIVQIRRSSYHDVIRVSEIQKLLDIAGVQTYIINSARVVFLNHRPQPRPGNGVTNTCLVCDRSLLDTFSFCSLGCKVAGTSGGFHGYGKRVGSQPIMPPSKTNMGVVYGGGNGGEKRMKMEVHLSISPSTPPPTFVNYRTAKRRKGIPHRAPLGVLTT